MYDYINNLDLNQNTKTKFLHLYETSIDDPNSVGTYKSKDVKLTWDIILKTFDLPHNNLNQFWTKEEMMSIKHYLSLIPDNVYVSILRFK